MRYTLLIFFFMVLQVCQGCVNVPRASAGVWMDSAVEMSDSGAVYDVWILARVRVDMSPDSLKVDIRITSPDGTGTASDCFVMPVNRMVMDSLQSVSLRYVLSEFSCDVEGLYRTGVRPRQYGRWVISCRTDDPSVVGIQARVENMEQ